MIHSTFKKPLLYLQIIRCIFFFTGFIAILLGIGPHRSDRVLGFGLTFFFVYFILKAVVEFITGKVEGALSILNAKHISKEIFRLNILMGAIVGLIGTIFGLAIIIR